MTMTPERWDGTSAYLNEVFGRDEEPLSSVMPRAAAEGVPEIAVDASVGRLLTLLTGMTGGGRGASLALEVGSLAGYSTAWIARGLRKDPPGRLIAIEPEQKHAAIVERTLREAGLADRCEVRREFGLEAIRRIAREHGDRSIDLVFLDAVKTEYSEYFRLVRPLLRPGGLLLADNTLGGSWWITDAPGSSPSRDAIDLFNREVAVDEGFDVACVPLREGVLIARRRG